MYLVILLSCIHLIGFITMAKPIIMGRKTFDSIGRPLPGRTNIVLSRDAEFNPEGVEVATTLEQALSIARHACLDSNVEEIMIIGGEQIYRMTIQVADRLYLTEVDVDIHGDAFALTLGSVNIHNKLDTHTHNFIATVAPFRAWRGLQFVVAGGPAGRP